MTVDDYVRALDAELRDQRRSVRRSETQDLREHLEELPPGALDELEEPDVYAREYREQRGLRTKNLIGAWRRVSWPQRVVTVVIVAIVVAVAVAVPVISHYQPVTVDVDMTGPGTAKLTPHQEPIGDGNTYVYREGATIFFGIEFVNPGRFDATVTSLPDRGELGPLQLERFVVNAPPYAFANPPGKTAHFPFRVPAHSTRTAVMTFRMTTCKFGPQGEGGGGVSAGIGQLFFTMKVLGVHHNLVVPLTGIGTTWIDFPKQASPCPTKAPATTTVGG